MNAPPCVECLILPMCLSRYREERLADINVNYKYSIMSQTMARLTLQERCKLLDSYLRMPIPLNSTFIKVQQFNDIFECKEWK